MQSAVQDLLGVALVALIGGAMLVALGDGGVSLPSPLSRNQCADGSDLTRYGSAATYDGVHISGSPEFVGLTIQAMKRTQSTPSYPYVRKIRSIEERPLKGAHAMIYPHNARAYVDPQAARMGCTLYGPILVHEGSHVVYGYDHKTVYAIHAQALREMGENSAAIQADQQSAASSNGYGDRRQAWR